VISDAAYEQISYAAADFRLYNSKTHDQEDGGEICHFNCSCQVKPGRGAFDVGYGRVF
jgi:hypothetical protein